MTGISAMSSFRYGTAIPAGAPPSSPLSFPPAKWSMRPARRCGRPRVLLVLGFVRRVAVPCDGHCSIPEHVLQGISRPPGCLCRAIGLSISVPQSVTNRLSPEGPDHLQSCA
ncbi:hypothetical protein LZ31DRAFT_554256 [Colletotrichum somersetense]|nr:hypothetical protein LZ31DRAFT_554256 [Colletotrichum somersetense]